MRVLHVVPSFFPAVRYGGPIYSLLHLCTNLRDLGATVSVLTTDAHGDARLSPKQREAAALDGLHVRFCRRFGGGSVAPGLVRYLLREVEHADVVHLTAVYSFPTIPTLVASRLLGKPLVWSPRGALQRWSGSRRSLLKTIWERVCQGVMPRSTVLHVTSKEEAGDSIGRISGRDCICIPNGIVLPALPPPPAPSTNLKLLFIGRLDPKKGIENLLAACSELGDATIADWTLRIVGAGQEHYVRELQRLAAAISPTRITFGGHLEGHQKWEAFAASDVVVVPSNTENFGIVVGEALAHGRPVIASRGTPWYGVIEHQCGLWVENDPRSLARAIAELGRADRVKMGLRGRSWMEQDFSWRDIARRMLGVYDAVTRRKCLG